MQKNLIESQIIFDLKQVESDYKVFRKLNNQKEYLHEKMGYVFNKEFIIKNLNEINEYIQNLFYIYTFDLYSKKQQIFSHPVFFDEFLYNICEENLKRNQHFELYYLFTIPKTEKGKIISDKIDSLGKRIDELISQDEKNIIYIKYMEVLRWENTLGYGIHEHKFLVETPPDILQGVINAIQKNLNYINENKNTLSIEYQKILEKFEQNFERSKQRFYEMLESESTEKNQLKLPPVK